MTQKQIDAVLVAANLKPGAENTAAVLGGFNLEDVSDLEIRQDDNGKKYAVIWTKEGEHRNHGARVEPKTFKPATTREAIAEELKAKERGTASVMCYIREHPENNKDIIVYEYEGGDKFIIQNTQTPAGAGLTVWKLDTSEQVKEAATLAKIYTAPVLAIYEQNGCIFLQVNYKK